MKPKKLEIALSFAGLGAKILPEGKNKIPMETGWQNKATNDPEQIRKWAKRWPTCNFASLTGSKSGFFALDIDVKNGDRGKESWEKLKKDANCKGVYTVVVQTGSGGHHVYFRLPDFEVPLIQEIVGYPGIEVKGEKGKVTLPGSTYNSGQEYSLLQGGVDIAPCPDWLARVIKTAKKVKRAAPTADEIKPGNRDINLFKIGCSWRSSGMDFPEILTGLLEINKKLEKPLPEGQVREKAESAVKYPKGKKKRSGPSVTEFTDVANCERFFKEYGDRLHYSTIAKTWLYWTGKVWADDDNQVVPGLAKKTAKKLYKRAWETGDSKLAKKAIACKSRTKIESMLALAKSEGTIPVRPDELDKDPWLWNCEKGVMDLREVGLLASPDPARLLTKLSPVSFDDAARCPRWDQFLLEIMSGDKEMVSFLQRIAGYCLTGDMSERKYFTFYGRGNNGKTVFTEVLMELFGDYAATALRDTFLRRKSESIQHDIARLRGARLVCVAETSKGSFLDEELVKQWVGQDTLAGRFLYGKAFDFRPVGKLVIRTNYRPNIKGQDAGIWSRSLFVNFAEQFEGERQDKKLKGKLQEELSGILGWCLVGCADWQSKGLAPPEKVLADGVEYREESDDLGEFFSEYLVKDPGAKITNARLYELYLAYCEEAGEKRPWNRKWLGRNFAERGYQRGRDSAGRYWVGIGER